MGFRDGSGISWTICKQSAHWSRQITTPTPRHSIFPDRMLFRMPIQQHWRPCLQCGQCHIYSWRRKLNTELLVFCQVGRKTLSQSVISYWVQLFMQKIVSWFWKLGRLYCFMLTSWCVCVVSAEEETSNSSMLGKPMTAERPQKPSSMSLDVLVLVVLEFHLFIREARVSEWAVS